jgi:hypothetical protein
MACQAYRSPPGAYERGVLRSLLSKYCQVLLGGHAARIIVDSVEKQTDKACRQQRLSDGSPVPAGARVGGTEG